MFTMYTMKKVITKIIDRLLIVTINRPGHKNAVDNDTAQMLHDAFMDFDQNDHLDIAILTGAGDTFCAGADLKAIASEAENAPKLSTEGRAPMGVSRLVLSKPVIAAVEGHAVAGGLELALWCDLRVASQNAVFGVYCRRFGIPLVDGGTIRLPRLIGHSHAMDMILTGRGVQGEEARMMGLVNRLTGEGNALAEAVTLAKSLSALPQTCMRSDRFSAYEQWDLDFRKALENETIHGLKVLQSGDTLAGAKKFARKDY